MNDTTIEVRKWAIERVLAALYSAGAKNFESEDVIASAKKLEAYVLGDEPMLKHNITNFQVS